ncbi:5'/3'-nucleotidase SurE [Pantoea sp. At-9b]|uniref:5'/3'-nucleotidase SurE n=1 Tax=Pantoea sp. (strain At-9b) TaxID=592316 RepID=UPI0001B3E4CC|nr:5'/3'-nucleotidase SurE [Pantoea sp. At-9b]ADU69047.1 stationary-phase survival protein SurE [Pantoea sp. At-9b]
MSQQPFMFERVLLTNDDGINAPGIAVLERVARRLAREVWIVAPEHDQSGTSHSISLHQPLRVAQRDEFRFGVSGTPGDCVAMAVSHLMQGKRPDLLLSGINRGANLGVETLFSGTVGAAMTGMLLGVPSLALSQAFHDRANVPWQIAEHHAERVIRQLCADKRQQNACLNVNFPAQLHHEQLTFTRQGNGHLNGINVLPLKDPRALDYYWLQLSRHHDGDQPGTESDVLAKGGITVTPLGFDRTLA